MPTIIPSEDEETDTSAPRAEEAEEETEDAKPGLELPIASSEIPDWVIVPNDFRPKRGVQLFFFRFPQALTGSLHGEHQCVVSVLSDKEEQVAADRAMGNSVRAANEYPKQMLRVVDGVRVDWGRPAGPGSVDEFWRNIGPKGRNLLMRIYTKLHMAGDEEFADFFANCVAVYAVS